MKFLPTEYFEFLGHDMNSKISGEKIVQEKT